ncbi:MAG: tripartite tricarboxylate transporter TctB family protein [Deltaproteobacteria bacterium]|nr:tripartite tricarboxylate transporter TctB family protein [Deltaproteobacteria bacterium]
MRKKNIYFLLLLLAVLVTGLIITLGYRPRARLFPLLVIVFCGILALVELLKVFRASPEPEAPKKKEGVETDQETRRKFYVTTAWIGGFTLSIWLFGFAAGMPLFILVYLKTHDEGWLWTTILPIAMFVIVYFIFGILLETPLYEGWLFLQLQNFS